MTADTGGSRCRAQEILEPPAAEGQTESSPGAGGSMAQRGGGQTFC